MAQDRLTYLFYRHFHKEITREERSELYELLASGAQQAELEALVAETLNSPLPDVPQPAEVKEIILGEILGRKQQTKIFSIRRLAVAASIIAVITAGLFALQRTNQDKSDDKTVITAKATIPAPQSNRASIRLANGQTIYLDSAQNGSLGQFGSVQLVKMGNGQISYRLAGDMSAGSQHELNTLTNPRGSQVIDMMLSDGSRVWLNAGSSITYPVAFAGNERKVDISGEAYFEVAHDAAKPFYVSKGEMSVQVLGTHFNVNAFDDEKDIKVTLLEGSVKVTKGAAAGLLKPGQQATIGTGVKVSSNVQLDNVMAWKNGYFSFDNTNFETVMREVSRWYDVEIVYEGVKPAEQFMGGVSRQEKISELLKVLEATGKVHFRIDGRKVLVRK